MSEESKPRRVRWGCVVSALAVAVAVCVGFIRFEDYECLRCGKDRGRIVLPLVPVAVLDWERETRMSALVEPLYPAGACPHEWCQCDTVWMAEVPLLPLSRSHPCVGELRQYNRFGNMLEWAAAFDPELVVAAAEHLMKSYYRLLDYRRGLRLGDAMNSCFGWLGTRVPKDSDWRELRRSLGLSSDLPLDEATRDHLRAACRWDYDLTHKAAQVLNGRDGASNSAEYREEVRQRLMACFTSQDAAFPPEDQCWAELRVLLGMSPELPL